MRIDKFLSQLKITSRKDVQSFLKKEMVCIDKTRIIDASYHVDPNHDIITINGEQVFYQSSIHLAIYKPKGYLSANHDALHPCVVDLLKPPYHQFDFKIAGRLDLDSEGLMILTTDGQFQHEITHPKRHLIKRYEVLLDQPFKDEKKLLEGVTIKDGNKEDYLAKALDIKSEGHRVNLSIDEGKFHQVKRMFQHVEYEVLILKRIQIGKLSIGNLKPSEYIEIKKEDLYD